MNLERVLAALRSELENLDAAILSLERLQQKKPRRGRPPSWMVNRAGGDGRPAGRSKKPTGGRGRTRRISPGEPSDPGRE